MNVSQTVDVVVIGAGAAGLAAANKLLALRPHLRIALFERDEELGGILLQCLHTGFGLSYFRQELTGPEYAKRVVKESSLSGMSLFLSTHVTAIHNEKIVEAVGPQGKTLVQSQFLVLATGSREIPFGPLGIPSSRPAGIFNAGEAQYMINRKGWLPGKKVVILGAGDIGLIMCRRCLFEGIDVAAIIERRAVPGGMPRNVQTCVLDYDVPLYTESTIVEVHGKGRVEAITIAKVDSTGRPLPSHFQTIPCDTLLIAVGLLPEIDLALDLGAERDGNALLTDSNGKTTIPWVWACGNARLIHPIVDDVSREGEMIAQAIATCI